MTENFDSFDKPPTSQPAVVPATDFFSSSPELNKLFEALAKAQLAMRPAVLDMVNPHYNSKYASITSCQDSYREPLAANGLAILQQVYSDGQAFYIRSLLGHSSGQWIATTFKLIVERQNMQGIGSAITYGRRYGVNSLIGVVDTEDDDGNQSLGGQKAQPAPQQAKPQAHGAAPTAGAKGNPGGTGQTAAGEAKKQNPVGPVTEAQIKRLFAISNASKWTNEQVKLFMDLKWKIDSTKNLTREKYDFLVDTIQQKTYVQACIAAGGRSDAPASSS